MAAGSSLLLSAGKIQVVFERAADRFAHRIGLIGGEDTRWILTSVEGGPADQRPPSPPLQELHLEERGGGVQVALLVGMAGRDHWSASCQIDPNSGEVQLDIACRLKSEPWPLGSLYRLSSESDLKQQEGWSTLETPWEALHFECQEGTAVEMPAESKLAFQAPLPESVPQTVQWRYRFWTDE